LALWIDSEPKSPPIARLPRGLSSARKIALSSVSELSQYKKTAPSGG
jgi:hypothetical protein